MAVLCLFKSIQIVYFCANMQFMKMYNHVIITEILDKYLLLTIKKNDQMNTFHAQPRKHENAINPSSKLTEQEKWRINNYAKRQAYIIFPSQIHMKIMRFYNRKTQSLCSFIPSIMSSVVSRNHK